MDKSLHLDIERILHRVLDASMPGPSVRKALQDPDLWKEITDCRHVSLIAVGKASLSMAAAAQSLLQETQKGIDAALVVAPQGYGPGLPGMEMILAGHPLPDENSLVAGTRAFEIADRLGRDDLLLFLVSGGGSALIDVSAPGIDLDRLRAENEQLIGSGMRIHEINAARCALSRLKGGGLLRRVAPARVIQLVLSDVPGDDVSIIASGPCVFPAHLRNTDEALSLSSLVTTRIVGSSSVALDAGIAAAEELGYRVLPLTSMLEGEAASAGQFFAAIAREILQRGRPSGVPCAVMASGETVVRLPERPGRGGRNTHLALAAAIALDGLDHVALASLGTDGRDGSADAAGGIVDGSTAGRISRGGFAPIQLLRSFNSRQALEVVDGLLVTGPTGTNVNDFIVMLIG